MGVVVHSRHNSHARRAPSNACRNITSTDLGEDRIMSEPFDPQQQNILALPNRTEEDEKTSEPQTTEATTEDTRYLCTVPGCGVKLNSPQGLGAHLKNTHGIAGTSKKTKQRQTSPKKPTTQRTRTLEESALSKLIFGGDGSIPPTLELMEKFSDLYAEAKNLYTEAQAFKKA